METVISFTPSQLVTFITTIAACCAGIATIVGIIIKLVMRMKRPEMEQNARIKALEDENKERKEEIKDLKAKLDEGNLKFEDIDRSNKVILRSLSALLAQSLGADATEALKEAKRELDQYLIDK